MPIINSGLRDRHKFCNGLGCLTFVQHTQPHSSLANFWTFVMLDSLCKLLQSVFRKMKCEYFWHSPSIPQLPSRFMFLRFFPTVTYVCMMVQEYLKTKTTVTSK